MSAAGALGLSGRLGEVAAAAEKRLRAAEVCESGPQRFSLGLAEVLALTAAGSITEADRVCQRYSALAAGVPQAEAIVTALKGRVEFARGALPESCDALQTALSAMLESFPVGWVMLVAAWWAQAEGARGNAELATAARREAEASDGPQVAVFRPELELARAWEHAALGETTRARAHAQRAGQQARRAGAFAVEMRALHTAVRFGDRSHVARLNQLAKMLGTPLAQAMSTHARGLADHDGDRLDSAVAQFSAVGAMALAADAAAQATLEHAHAGRRAKELGSSSRAHWLARQCGLHTPAVVAACAPLPMTDRECEIARLVGDGLTNRQIADRLCVSVRTIEGHLYRLFAKLDIDDRSQLADLMRARAAN